MNDEFSAVDVSKADETTSEPEAGLYSGRNLGDSRLLPRWCPAYRQHEPGPGSCCLYAGHHLGSKRLSPRFLPEKRPASGSDVVSSAFDTSTAENSSFIAHLPGPHLTRSQPRLFPRRSRRRSLTNAPRGGLEPPSARRLRRAKQPPSLVQHRSPRDRQLLPSLPRFPRSCSQDPPPTPEGLLLRPQPLVLLADPPHQVGVDAC